MASFGDTRTVTAVVRDAADAVIPGATVTWTVSPSGVVTLSPSSGLATTATATGNGTATITATSGTVTQTKAVTVAQQFASLSVTPATASITATGTRQLTATPRDARGNTMSLAGTTWTSTDDAVATVSTSGLVTGVVAGTAKIIGSLTAQSTTKLDTADITVTSGSFPSAAEVTATTTSQFNPQTVDIADEGTVTWVFQSVTHNVQFAATAGAPADIGNSTSTSVSRTFSTPGTFTYSCGIHAGMTGTVVVH